MKRLLTTVMCAVALLVITTSHSQATLIVDTGTPTPVSYGIGETDAEFAGLISISETMMISRIEGYFQQETSDPFSVHIYIYSDTASNPDYDFQIPHNEYPAGTRIYLGDLTVPVYSDSY